MVGENPGRQYLLARESGMWLAEAERTEPHLFDLDYENDDDLEVRNEKAWLDHIRARRNVLDEELLEMQGGSTT
jgi:hypothetical protein